MRTRRSVAIGAAAVTVIGAASAIAVVVHSLGERHVGATRTLIVAGSLDPPIHHLMTSAPAAASPTATATPPPSPRPSTTARPTPRPTASSTVAPASTQWHYTANGNFNASGAYAPGIAGFNLADASSVAEVNTLPAGDEALVFVGLCIAAADPAFTSSFIATVQPYVDNPRVFGFYLMDEPDPRTCPPANLAAESDWIHANIRGARTFIVMMNVQSPDSPSYAGTYTPQNSHVDLAGIDPYPVRTGLASPAYVDIPRCVAAAEAVGWPKSSIVPVFQAFGGGNWGGTWTLPTPAQEQHILTTWAGVLPAPEFDYAYSWGPQNGDTSLSLSPALQAIFAAHNA